MLGIKPTVAVCKKMLGASALIHHAVFPALSLLLVCFYALKSLQVGLGDHRDVGDRTLCARLQSKCPVHCATLPARLFLLVCFLGSPPVMLGLTRGPVIKNHSWWSLGDPRGCLRSNPGLQRDRQPSAVTAVPLLHPFCFVVLWPQTRVLGQDLRLLLS